MQAQKHSSAAEMQTQHALWCCIARLVFVVICCGSPVAIAADETSNDQVTRIIGVERERQHRVGGSIQKSIVRVADLIADFKSNKFVDDPGNNKLEEIHDILVRLSEDHVPRAREFLEQAGADQTQRSTMLRSAGEEVEIVVKRLNELIAEAGLEQQRRAYAALLQEIAEGQWDTLHKTVTWGRATAERLDNKEKQGNALATEQYLHKDKLSVFFDELNSGLSGDTSKELLVILKRTKKALDEGNVSTHQLASAKALTEKDAARSVAQQQTALIGLQRALDILNGLESEELDRILAQAALKEKIRKIITEERAVRLEVLNLTREELAAENEQVGSQQKAITEKLSALVPEIRTSFPLGMMGAAVEMALIDMNKAEAALSEVKRDLATDAQLRAIEMLETALQDMDAGLDMFNSDYMGLGLADFGSDIMMEAFLSIPYGLEEMLMRMNMMGVDMGQLMTLDGAGGFGEGGLGAGTAAGGGQVPGFPGDAGESGDGASSAMGMPGDVGSAGGFRWGSDAVGEDEVARGDQSMGALEQVARKQIEQIYSRGLPPELRNIVQDYFEVIAAGKK